MEWNRSLLVAVIGGLIIGAGILTTPAHAGNRVKSTSERGWWKQGGVFHSIPELPPNPAAMEAKRLLDEASPEPWGVEWNERTGLPKSVWGTLAGRYSGSPEEIAREFLAKFRPLFTGLAPADDPGFVTFELERVIQRGEKYTVVSFAQLFRGIEVYRSGASVIIDLDGHVISAHSSGCVIADVDVTPSLSSDAAVASLRAALHPDSMLSSEPSLVIYPNTHPPSLAYMVRAGISEGRNFWPNLLFIDAATGAVLRATPLHTADLRDKPERPSSDSASPRDRVQDLLQSPSLKRIPVIQIPRDDSSTLHDVPPDTDTTEPIPRSYKLNPDQLTQKEELGRQMSVNASTTGVSTLVWFYSADYCAYAVDDLDSDDYDCHASLEWDADTYDPELDLKGVVYARDSQNNVFLLGETYWFTIRGVEADLMWFSFDALYRDEWDFRIALVDRSGDTLNVLEYGDEPQGGGIPENIKMERVQEDRVFIELDPSVAPTYHPGTDTNEDGYFASCTLTCDVRVQYDSTYTLFALFKARNTASEEILLGMRLSSSRSRFQVAPPA